MFHRLSRHAVAMLTGGALGIAVTTALEVLTAPYSPAVSAYAFNGVVHLLKVVAVIVFVLGFLGFSARLRTELGRVGSTAVTVLALATPLGAVPYSLAEASLDPGVSPGAANEQLDAIYATHTWISLLAMVALPLIVASIITLGIVVLRRRLVPAWGPVASLCAIPIAVAAGALAESGLPLPHPPAWIFLGLAAYGPALTRSSKSAPFHSGPPATTKLTEAGQHPR